MPFKSAMITQLRKLKKLLTYHMINTNNLFITRRTRFIFFVYSYVTRRWWRSGLCTRRSLSWWRDCPPSLYLWPGTTSQSLADSRLDAPRVSTPSTGRSRRTLRSWRGLGQLWWPLATKGRWTPGPSGGPRRSWLVSRDYCSVSRVHFYPSCSQYFSKTRHSVKNHW